MTKLVRFSPNRELNRMQHEFDRIFNDFFPTRTHFRGTHQAAQWAPRVDLSETEDGYTLKLDLPGLDKKDITVNFQDGVLTISGERKQIRSTRQAQEMRAYD